MMSINELYIITPWYNVFSGGAEVAARTLAEECVKRNIKTTVLTTCCKTPYDSWWNDSMDPGEEDVNGVTVKRFRLSNYGKEKYESTIIKQVNNQALSDQDKLNFFKYGISSDDLCEYVSSIDKTIPIIVLPYFQALAYNVITKNPNRISIIPCFHNEEQFFWNEIDEMIKYCDKIFYLSEPEKDMTIKQYGLKYGKKVIESIVLGLGVEIPDHIQNKLSKQDLKKYNLPDKYILYVGRKDIGKGIKQLVDYHSKITNEIPVVFIGGGDKSLIPSNDRKFIDLGFVSEEDKYNLINNASILVNLSKNESFSIVIMEAWLAGIPTIVNSKCDVTKYHCQTSGGGFWIANSEEYAKTIDLILSNPDVAKKVGQQGKEYVQSQYRWDYVIYKLLRVFNGEEVL